MKIRRLLLGTMILAVMTGCVTRKGDDCSTQDAQISVVKWLKEGGIKQIVQQGYMEPHEARQMLERLDFSFDSVGSTKKEEDGSLVCKGKFLVQPKPDFAIDLEKAAEEQREKGTILKNYGFKGIAERSGYLADGDNKATFMLDFTVARKNGKITAEADWENTGYFSDFMANIAESLTHAKRDDKTILGE